MCIQYQSKTGTWPHMSRDLDTLKLLSIQYHISRHLDTLKLNDSRMKILRFGSNDKRMKFWASIR